MRRRGPMLAISSSPVMVGAITTLIAIVAVFLAYNANNGLPFVPVYRVSVEVPNASRVLNNNEVRIGGQRVGVVESIEAVQLPVAAESGDRVGDATSNVPEAAARLNLKLDEVARPLPMDSQFRIRYRSAFGLKYLEVVRGEGDPAPEGYLFADADSSRADPAENTAEVVDQTEFDEIYNTFDAPTRDAIRVGQREFGGAFAGRGQALNRIVEAAAPLFRFLEPVAATLGADRTQLDRFIAELADGARIVAPEAIAQAELFANAALTFAAFTADEDALDQAIAEGPDTLRAGIELLPGQTRLLRKATALSAALAPGTARLSSALPLLSDAAETGTPVLRRVPELEPGLIASFGELRSLVARPETGSTLERLGELFDNLAPIAGYLVPAQTVCNYWNYFFAFVPGTIADDDQVGWNVRQRALTPPVGNVVLHGGGEELVIPGEALNSVGGYAGMPAAGIAGLGAGPEAGVFDPYTLPIQHGNPYGPTGQDGDDCQAGQVGYVLGNLPVPGQPKESPSFIVSDIPGSRGPTTLFFNERSERELRDTRVGSRQP